MRKWWRRNGPRVMGGIGVAGWLTGAPAAIRGDSSVLHYWVGLVILVLFWWFVIKMSDLAEMETKTDERPRKN